MYDTYRIIFIGGLVLSLVFFVLSVFIFFFLRIKDAMDELSGRQKRRALKALHEGKPSPVAADAERIPKKPADKKPTPTSQTGDQMTSRMSIQDHYNAMEGGEDTSLLQKPQPTPPPVQQPRQPAPSGVRQQSKNYYVPVVSNDPDFIVEADIGFVHSSEVIA